MAPATKEEKLQTGLEHKAAGNAAFGKQDFGEALRCYHLSILFLSGLDSDSSGVLGLLGGEADRSASATNAEAKNALSAVYCNMALIYLKQLKYDKAIGAAEKSLKHSDAQSTMAVKAKYRKAQALRLSGEVFKARDYLNSLLNSAAESEKATLQSELKLVQQTIDSRTVQDRNKWKGFLSKSPRVFDTTDAQAPTDA